MPGTRNDLFGQIPGFGTATETLERAFLWGREYNVLWGSGQIDGTARDAGNTPTTVLRSGLLMGRITSSGNLIQYSAAATDGSNEVVGVLPLSYRMQDLDGNNVPRFVPLVIGGPVQAAQLLGLDETARQSMSNRFIFDDRNYQAYGAGRTAVVAKTADYTVVNGTDNGAMFTNRGATGAVVFTLPTTLVRGNRFRFYVEADFAVTVTAPSGKLVSYNNAAATSLAISTTAKMLGGSVEVRVNDDASKYLAIVNLANIAQVVTLS